MVDIALLSSLLAIDSPAGDEHRMADWLINWLEAHAPDCAVTRLRDCLVVAKGEQPTTAIFAHIDTIGYTVAYAGDVYPIGHPATPEEHNRVRVLGVANDQFGTLKKRKSGEWKLDGLDCAPGDRLVTAASPIFDAENKTVTSPYLDNRGGIYAALQTLLHAKQVVVAFTTGEETGGSGAKLCARHIYETLGVANAIISDITWHTKHVHCGKGVAISRRDSGIPSQRFLDKILQLANASGISYQIEIESSGGSDGQGIENSGYPIDWVFIGAPEKRPHTPTEQLDLADLDAMAQMLVTLADRIER